MYVATCLLALASALGALGNGEVRQCNNPASALRHLETANALELNDTFGADREYQLAIKACGHPYPEASRQLSQCLARRLLFSKAAAVLRDLIKWEQHLDSLNDRDELRDLEKAAALQARIDKAAEPALNDLLEFIPIARGYGTSSAALPYAERTVKLYPNSSDGYVALARLLNPSDPARSLQLLEKAVEVDAGNAEAHAQRGWYYFWSSRRVKDAEEDFRLALQLSNERNATAWHGLGYVFASRGQKREAIQALRKYLRTRDNSVSEYDSEINRMIEQLEKSIQR